MKDASLTALVESMSSASKNVDISVKCRIGVFDEENRPLNERDYQYLTNYISAIHDAGARHVILHARPAILSLNPVKNRNIPTLDYDVVSRIASDFEGKVDITMNGGIASLKQLRSLQKDEAPPISSYMAGRWCLRRPLDLVAIERSLEGGAITDAQVAVESYLDYALAHASSKSTMAELCLPLFLVVEQLREDYEREEDGSRLTWEEMEKLYGTIQDGLNELGGGRLKTSNSINFKRLASSFKPLVGTKVVNKWKRNRAEL